MNGPHRYHNRLSPNFWLWYFVVVIAMLSGIVAWMWNHP